MKVIRDCNCFILQLKIFKGTYSDLFCVELVELCLLAVAPPETQDLGFGAVGHVDELLVPPTFIHCADVAA